ncbi:MAG: transcription elongation factor GreA [bacterium]
MTVNDSNEKKIFLTPSGFKKLEDELQHLIVHRRSEVAERIAQAKEYGDLSENSEYEAAKEEQAFVEGRISQVQQMIKNAAIINETAKHDNVDIGSKVKVNGPDGEETYTIVGSAEANPLEGKISNESPIGQALLGKKVGATVTIKIPVGSLEMKIVEIS